MRDYTAILTAVDKAVPLKTEIELVHKSEFRDLQNKFMTELGAPKKITTIVPDSGEENTKSMGSIFKMLAVGVANYGGDIDNETKHGLLERKFQDIGWIVYFSKIADLENELKLVYKFFGINSIDIDVSHYDSYFSGLKTMNQDVIKNVIITAAEDIKRIHALEQQIEHDIFESIGASVYNKDTNPDGIRLSEFLALVNCKANDDVEKQKEKQILRQEEIAEQADAFVDILKQI